MCYSQMFPCTFITSACNNYNNVQYQEFILKLKSICHYFGVGVSNLLLSKSGGFSWKFSASQVGSVMCDTKDMVLLETLWCWGIPRPPISAGPFLEHAQHARRVCPEFHLSDSRETSWCCELN